MKDKLKRFWLFFSFWIFYYGYLNRVITHESLWVIVLFGLCLVSTVWDLLKIYSFRVEEDIKNIKNIENIEENER